MAGRAFLEVVQELREGRSRITTPSPAPAREGAPAEPSVGRWVGVLVDRVGAGEARVDALLEAAARGKTFKPAELIAMQAQVFRCSQTVEVISRGADRLVGAVKQTLGTQV